MDGDFFSTSLSEDDDIQFDDDLDPEDHAQDGERCGICMDLVIDRGVLDCCEHWFCFLCIDNWATITNLCPLCQNEFQSITCVPVYDTTGSSGGTEDSDSRDKEWSIEEKNNTLSFPSYYIDENEVVCLSGDGCRLQCGLESYPDDPNMDTSIACDSCDLWYHAFCVGFDTNDTSESTWLCPRCTDGEQHKLNESSLDKPADQLCLDRSKEGYRVESSISSKVSVSIADSGETAVVVSMVTQNQLGEGSKENSLSNIEVCAPESGFDTCSLKRDLSNNHAHETSELLGAEHPLLLESSEQGLPNLVVTSKLKEEVIDKVTDGGNNISEAECVLETNLFGISSVKSRDDIVVHELDKEETIICHPKRKVRDCSPENTVTTPDKEMKSEVDTIRDSSKRPRTNHSIEISNDSARNPNSKPEFNDQKLTQSMQHGEKTDIEKESGRRVKKIMRRSTEGHDSLLLEKLRQEIREAVQNKSTKDVGELFNPKLLAAFQAAVAGPKTVQRQRLSFSALRMKQSLLQKGKVRENLTKKIYATSNGRRKRAWDRDCEIEFWKHRCLQTSKPEKIEALKSVLGLLRSSSLDPETGKLVESKDANPILSRLYLADTSIFPRKNDIKPVVALHKADTQHPNKEERTSEQSSFSAAILKPLGGDLKAQGGTKKVNAPIVTDKGVNRFSTLKGPNNNNGASYTQFKGSVTSQSSISKPDSQREAVVQSDIKSDKRRWALEVLARKTAKPGQITSSPECLGDITLFNGNYPILSQLPIDMRPTPMKIHRDKIPMHVRQTQLYRLTEHLLKHASLPIIRRTAVTELAVADALNIEKEIAQRSNSKLVYLNLCSQEVVRHSDSSAANSKTSVNSGAILPSADTAEEQTNIKAVSDPAVEDALKNAGLLSESPPGSPRLEKDVRCGVDGPSNKMKDDTSDNVLEINSHSKLDHKDVNDLAVATCKVEGVPKVNVIMPPLTPLKVEKNMENADHLLAQSLEKPSCPSSIEGKTDEHCQDSAINLEVKESNVPTDILDENGRKEIYTAYGQEFDVADTEPHIQSLTNNSFPCEKETKDGLNRSTDEVGEAVADSKKPSPNYLTADVLSLSAKACSGEPSKVDETANDDAKKSHVCNSVSKKVEAFIKEHIRPLCKSGVITAEQYRWAVAKTTQKVMKYHSKDKNANFLIKEGEKVKKLALQYLEGSQKAE